MFLLSGITSGERKGRREKRNRSLFIMVYYSFETLKYSGMGLMVYFLDREKVFVERIERLDFRICFECSIPSREEA